MAMTDLHTQTQDRDQVVQRKFSLSHQLVCNSASARAFDFKRAREIKDSDQYLMQHVRANDTVNIGFRLRCTPFTSSTDELRERGNGPNLNLLPLEHMHYPVCHDSNREI
ncbi:hypothetical protein IRJ41_002656 [Triplophysa rosa]|uniref:Uncharacterized protein n=1 Tax=Triplophysa rosa TaxID=992332 RepID=A0A9W7WY68_TRIRA|nr:hypothetical protein IRJ41_002656 [Triplophysa rosa]